MKKILITGGTVFVSRYAVNYYVNKGYKVYVLNRGRRPQEKGVHWIKADRNDLGDLLRGYDFDAILDITAYTGQDVEELVEAVGSFKNYIFISSSAVYPETLPQPFREEQPAGSNAIWKAYGTNKLEAEEYLLEHVPSSYILRPPYLYGEMQNIYREPFVFDCAMEDRPFYVPGDGKMKLQFFDVEDLCRFMDILMEQRPKDRIFNVGNKESITIEEWVKLCYEICGKKPEIVYVDESIDQRSFFPFYKYEYYLDVQKQDQLMPRTKPLAEGLRQSYEWYRKHRIGMDRRGYFEFIKRNLEKK